VQYALVLLGLDFPAALSLLDCFNREADEFEGGAEDRSAWLRWLIAALVLCPVLVGYGIVLGYYYRVVRRHSPMRM
jgi:hypothetical protein